MRSAILLAATVAVPFTLCAQPTIGLIEVDPANQDGYVLFAPLSNLNTYLIDKCGREVHEWSSAYRPGDAVYLLDDGTLLRTGNANNAAFGSGGKGGVIQRLDWNSNVLWEYTISDAQHCQHHDAFQIPGGHVLAVVWEKHTVAEAIAAGRNPVFLGTELWSEAVLELQPIGADSAAVVWEWHLWDHLVQEFDALATNYGVVQDHPELLDLNFIGGAPTQADWIHMNAIHYNAELDQIMVSAHNLSEVWVIDHSTTASEAAGHTGGGHGKGGDLLYRWGNPQVYDRGTATDRVFFGQHNAQWIAPGLPDQRKILVFNNGLNRPAGDYSTIEVFDPPVDANGDYALTPGQPYGPTATTWTWTDTPPEDSYSSNISGAQRLANGGLLICLGSTGSFFELDPLGNEVWRYINPVSQTGPLTQGDAPAFNSVFRSVFLPPSYAGLAGQVLTPGDEIELDPIVPSLCTSLGEGELAAGGVQLWPNPVIDQLHITLPDAALVEVALFDAAGRCCLEQQVRDAGALDVRALAPGTYLLQATANGTRWAGRVMIER